MNAGVVLGRMAALPFGDVATIAGLGPVLVLAPHPDDESLGCGGLILQASAAGIPVSVAILTDGTKSHPNSASYPAGRLRQVREAEAAAAITVLGVAAERLCFLGYPDTAAPRWGRALRDAGDRVAGILRAQAIRTVLAPWKHDPHCDHLAAHRIARRACRLTGVRHLSYPVWGWTLPPSHVLPRTEPRGWRLAIERELPAKRRAIDCHRSQMTDMIMDDPAGFRVPEGLLQLCNRPFETYLRMGG